jgi:aminoglycoside 6'-N-acetyltransferase I
MQNQSIKVRRAERKDLARWSEMRNCLWPSSQAEHLKDLENSLAEPDFAGFVAETREGVLIGFSEASIRKFANGCESSPVPFVEGCWVDPNLRNQKIGMLLVKVIEGWAKNAGFNELGSDSETSNTASLKAHQSWGFQETERVVYFRKSLNN